jgi:hypothetical protein
VIDLVTRNSLEMAIAQPIRWLLPVCLLTLVGCNSLDVRSLEANVKTQLQEQGRLEVKSITCPEGISKQSGAVFQCQGALAPEGKFIVQVEQKDDKGQTRWEVPNSKGVLNLALLEAELTKEIAKDTKAEPAVRCGSDRYRVNRPGDSFDCQVKNAVLAKAKGVIQKVAVTIDTEGNVSWQQIRLVQPAVAKAGTAPPSPSAATAVSPDSTITESSQPNAANSPQARPRQLNTQD